MNNALLRNLTLEELLHEMSLSRDLMIKSLLPQIDDLIEFKEKIDKHDIDLSLVVKDYQNFDMKLSDFLETEYWQSWDINNRESLSYQTDTQDRARRIDEASEHGLEGSTHGEVIQDWLDCLDDRDADLEFGPLTVQRLMIEAENVRTWHEDNGSIDEQIC